MAFRQMSKHSEKVTGPGGLVPHKLMTYLEFVRRGSHGLDPQHPCALGVWERLDSLGVGYSDLYSLSLLVDRLPRINNNRPNHKRHVL